MAVSIRAILALAVACLILGGLATNLVVDPLFFKGSGGFTQKDLDKAGTDAVDKYKEDNPCPTCPANGSIITGFTSKQVNEMVKNNVSAAEAACEAGNINDSGANVNAWEKVSVVLINPMPLRDWQNTYKEPTNVWWNSDDGKTGKEFEPVGSGSDVVSPITYSNFAAIMDPMIAGQSNEKMTASIQDYMLPRLQNLAGTKKLLAWQEIVPSGETPDEWVFKLSSENNPSKEYWHVTTSTSSVPDESDGRTKAQVTTPPTGTTTAQLTANSAL